ncbi:ATP-dependent helicase [Gemmiger sp.]|uniref:ATP-dependent helicase n=1 Tax=Gemmiger sp. TaxID=2049027 RepID=UPI002E76D278|nr:UvrD-helicase domain-containing protein [Gemmiger sp.]MED9883715.1 UvrD-helicase domain-containing protein [Gemmiger sp.]
MEKTAFETAHMAALNPQQRAAVAAVDGPVLLLAVPGSGKTTVLITRLGYMTEVCGIAPESILTMTYTVAATQEMRARFAARFGEAEAARMEFRTINGVAARIIALYSRMYGRTPPDLLQSESETTPLLLQLWQSINHEYAAESTLKELRTAITYIKNMCLTDAELDELETDLENLPELYRAYQQALKARHKMDYDDQLCFALQILNGAPAVAAAFRKRYRYFCVDESQDTSRVQHEIIRVLAQQSGNLFMVGDEDQSIYGFRAAYPQALMDFEKTYPGARVLLMEENYRSREPILAAANRFVARNRYRRPKTIAPTQGAGEPIRVVEVRRRADQLAFLFAEAQHCEVETAVLFRNHESALPIIDLCERRGVPYGCKAVEQTFFTNKIVRDVADIFALAARPDDADTFLRCYFKFGVLVTRAQALYAAGQARQYGQGCWTALINEDSIRPRTRAAMAEVAAGLARLPRMAADDAVRFLTDQLGYGKYLDKNGMDRAKLAVLEMLGAQEPTPRRLLRRLAELRTIVQEHVTPPGCKFLLSTIHSAKGLEYDRVILLDVLDGILPAKPELCCRTPAETRQYEEDRRLFYVAMTRARQELVLFDCTAERSSFAQEVLSGLPGHRSRPDAVPAGHRPAPAAARKPLPPVDMAAITAVGARVRHAVFGPGTVESAEGGRVTVRFAAGARTLDARVVADRHLLWAE